MTIQGQLLEMLETVASALGNELLERVVFVGGCSTALLITDASSLMDIRATDDVDLIVDPVGPVQWYQLEEQLRARGFTISAEDDLLCRLRLGDLKVDFMPVDDKLLGFSNRWYKMAVETAQSHRLPSGKIIKCVTSPLFLATKFEAYKGRGNDDPLYSHDLEDILIVIDGREKLVSEVSASDPELRAYIAKHFEELQSHVDFEHLLHGNIKGPSGRVDIVLRRIKALTATNGARIASADRQE